MSRPVFISYSSKDRAQVARLAADLAALDVRVWWDQWEIKVGDSLYAKIQQAITESAWLCAVLSPSSVSSPWVTRELNAALDREVSEKRVFVLPLLLTPCEVPLFLREKVYADFTSSYEEGFSALVSRLAPRLDQDLCRALMADEDERVESAARAIMPAQVAPYVGWLAARLVGDDAVQRRAALVALNAIGPRALLSYLGVGAKDSAPSIRMQAALYLSRNGSPGARALLHELTQDPVAFVRASARDGLRRLEGPNRAQ